MNEYNRRPPDRLTLLRDRYGPEAPLVHLDPDEPVEALLHAGSLVDPTVARALEGQLGALLDGAGGSERSIVAALQPLAPLPAGSSWLGWVRYVRSLIPRIAAGGVEFPAPGPGPAGVPVPVPASAFTDRSVADRAATDVLRRHEARLRAWAVAPEGRPRLHLYADLGRPVGTAPDLTDLLAPSPRPVSGCVVLMARDPGSDKPFVVTSHPERSLPEQARSRWDDLPLLFGGYFGQDLHSLDGTTWRAERAANEGMSPAVRARVVEQLTGLLDHDDDTLRAEVVSLGSYVLPVQLRRWVLGLRRRMSELDWAAS